MTRRMGLMGACMAVLVGAGLQPARAQTPAPLSIGASLNLSFAPVFVLADKDLGIAKKHDLDVSIKMFASGLASLEAALSGNLDLPIMNTAVALPVLTKACFKGSIMFTDFGSLSVVGSPDIHSVDDLVGKRVGTLAGAIGNTALEFWLDMHHIPRDKVTVVNVDAPDMPAALARGNVDAIIWSEPVPSQTVALLGPSKAHVIGNINEAYHDVVPLSVTCAWYEKNGDKGMENLDAAWIEAVDYLHAHPEKAAELTGARLKMDPAAVMKLWDASGWLQSAWPADLADSQIDMIEKNAAYLISIHKMDKMPDLSAWISSKWLKQVAPDRVHLQKYPL